MKNKEYVWGKLKRFFDLDQKKKQLSLIDNEYKEWKQLNEWYANYLVDKKLKDQELREIFSNAAIEIQKLEDKKENK